MKHQYMPLYLVTLTVGLGACHLSWGEEDQCPLAIVIDAVAIVKLSVFLSLQIDGIIAEHPLRTIEKDWRQLAEIHNAYQRVQCLCPHHLVITPYVANLHLSHISYNVTNILLF